MNIGQAFSFSASVFVLMCLTSINASSQCTPAVNGTIYWVTTNVDGGPGSLRQAILDANADNTGGSIEINGGWSTFPIFSQLPVVTSDSLIIFDYLAPITIDGQNLVQEPAITFATSTSCIGYLISGINFLPATLIVTSAANDGAGSLREAIRSANFSATSDIIAFDIPGPAPHRIQLNNMLPLIFKSLTIDGSTQPANGYTGTAPKIEIDGVTNAFIGLNFYFNSTPYLNTAAVYGVYMNGFSTAITTNRALNVTIGNPGKGNVISGNNFGLSLGQDIATLVQNNYIGTDTSGTVAQGNISIGLSITGIPNGVHTLQNNVISGNQSWGAVLYNDVRNVTIKGNLIGTDKTGTLPIPNHNFGISSSGNLITIGGTLPGEGNLFSGNCIISPVSSKTALFIFGDSTIVVGNKFGTDITGTDTLPNRHGSSMIINGSNNQIGGATVAERNIFAGSPVGISGSQGINNRIENNYFGTDLTGTFALPNNVAISLGGDTSMVIGNKIKYNQTGIQYGSSSSGNLVTGNEIKENATDGIWNWGIGNTFSQNAIANNGAMGILNYQSSNNGILPPVITAVSSDSVTGTALPGSTIELFYSVSGNSNAQGDQFIATITADNMGNWIYSGILSAPASVTATQTDSAGNTSEFSILWSQVTNNVWPGDCNYDLTVDNLDFVYLGMGMGYTGPLRSNASLNWTPQPAGDWNTSYFSGVNHKHADTDGNGVVSLLDVDAINQNYGLTHPFRLQPPVISSAVYDFVITASADTIAPGGNATYTISAGTTLLPVPQIYGIKWSLLFNADLVDTTQIVYNYSGSALGNLPTGIADFKKSFYAFDQVDVALTRLNLNDTFNLNGIIGSIEIQSKSSINTVETLLMNAVSILGLTINGTQVNFNVQPDSVIIDPTFVGVNELQEVMGISVFPNPFSNMLMIHSNRTVITNINIYDAVGKKIISKTVNAFSIQLSLQDLSQGFYNLEVTDSEGHVSLKKIIRN